MLDICCALIILFLGMKNITLKMDESLMTRVRHIAVDANVSVSAWVARLIEDAVRERDTYEKTRDLALQDLARPLSLGGKPMDRESLHER